MPDDAFAAIQAVLSSFNARDRAGVKPSPERPLVCISRDYGALGDEIAAELARRLDIDLWDSAILDKLSKRSHTDPHTARVLDEAVGKAKDLWLYSLLTHQDLSPQSIQSHLVNVIVSMGRLGGVIVGRGAHIVLARSPGLKVRIVGSTEACVHRVAKARQLTPDAARHEVDRINHERAQFIWDTYQVRQNDPHLYDLVINTDHLSDVGAVVDMLLQAQKTVLSARA